MIEKKTSKEYLEESAIELFSKNSVEKVSVNDICRNCGVSTRTYYNYFKDKYDIINQCYINRFRKYVKFHAEGLTFRDLMLYLAKEVCENPSFFRNVFRYTGQNNIRIGASESLCGIFVDTIRTQSKKEPDEDIKKAMQFYVDGILTYVERRLFQPNLPAPEESSEYCLNAIPDKLKQYL